jgi:UDP-N-acetylglucosamine/UDP-N-acetylgalactosamine diphosphorylase
VAGGHGTRLGCHGPKGLCSVGPVSKANLFKVLLGKLVAVRRRYGRDVPLAIMTSSATDAETRTFLAEHACCGLDPARVFVFRQHDLPALDAATGRLLLDAPGHLALAPDGHGGMLVALAEAGGLDWFGRQGVEHVVSFQVDNPLAMPLAAEFLGYHLLSAADFSTQVVRKQEPGERVGVVVDCDGRHSVVEYSDLPAEAAAERLPDGRLRFHAGSIAIHAFAKTFLDRAAARHDSLPLHLAFKAVPFLDADGRRVVPTAPNAYKFERFIFDLMPLAQRVCVVEIEASEGFAPLKNPVGSASDTVEHVHAAMVAHARRLLAKAGIHVADGVDVELAADRIIDETDVGCLLELGTLLDRPTVVGG